jgi:hypothetical protein
MLPRNIIFLLLVLASYRLSKPQGLVWLEILSKLKNSFTSSDLEPTIFQLVA